MTYNRDDGEVDVDDRGTYWWRGADGGTSDNLLTARGSKMQKVKKKKMDSSRTHEEEGEEERQIFKILSEGHFHHFIKNVECTNNFGEYSKENPHCASYEQKQPKFSYMGLVCTRNPR